MPPVEDDPGDDDEVSEHLRVSELASMGGGERPGERVEKRQEIGERDEEVERLSRLARASEDLGHHRRAEEGGHHHDPQDHQPDEGVVGDLAGGVRLFRHAVA